MPIRHGCIVTAPEPWGAGLHRPECVVGTSSGDVYVSDWQGGVGILRSDGSQQSWRARAAGFRLRPNGIAALTDGSFLVAHLAEPGGVWRLERDGRLEAFVTEVDGVPLPPANFVTRDAEGRTWISVSTRQNPRQRAWRANIADGFVVLVDAKGPRIVADGLHYTNEVRVSPAGDALFVVETFGRRLIRLPLSPASEVGAAETIVTFGAGTFPDGFAFDEAGGIWITSLVSNRVLRLIGGRIETVIEDTNASYVDEVERAFVDGTMQADHLGPIPDTTLQHVTSLTFAGADRRTVYLGSLHATCLYRFRSSVAGHES